MFRIASTSPRSIAVNKRSATSRYSFEAAFVSIIYLSPVHTWSGEADEVGDGFGESEGLADSAAAGDGAAEGAGVGSGVGTDTVGIIEGTGGIGGGVGIAGGVGAGVASAAITAVPAPEV